MSCLYFTSLCVKLQIMKLYYKYYTEIVQQVIKGQVLLRKAASLLASVDFGCLSVSYRSYKVLDIRVLPVAFTGSKPIT